VTGLGIVLAHLVGDYLLQSHWMATQKVHRWKPALAHAALYTVPYVLVTQAPLALLVIAGTHAVIDRYRLARYVVWAKNQVLSPRGYRTPWEECKATGMPPDAPPWLAVWLMFIADNTLHLAINTGAVAWLT
jgi:hypothetical protein